MWGPPVTQGSDYGNKPCAVQGGIRGGWRCKRHGNISCQANSTGEGRGAGSPSVKETGGSNISRWRLFFSLVIRKPPASFIWPKKLRQCPWKDYGTRRGDRRLVAMVSRSLSAWLAQCSVYTCANIKPEHEGRMRGNRVLFSMFWHTGHIYLIYWHWMLSTRPTNSETELSITKDSWGEPTIVLKYPFLVLLTW